MVMQAFSASALIKNATQINETNYEIIVKIEDKSGNYSAYDVVVNDYLFVDITNNRRNNIDVARFKVKSLSVPDVETLIAVFEYSDGGDVPDPNDYIDQPAFICRKPENRFGWIASSSLQTLPEYLITYARNIDLGVFEQIITKTEYRTLTLTEISNKKLTLAAKPHEDILVNVYNGPHAWKDDDFEVNGTDIEWNGLGLESVLDVSDRLIITYNTKI